MPHSLRHALGTLLIAGSVLLSGCSAITQVTRTTLSAPRATLVLNPELSVAHPLRAQAVVPRLTVADVDHIRLQLFRLSGETATPVNGTDGPLTLRIQPSDLGRPIVLSQLHPQTRYQVVAMTYKSSLESLENEISGRTTIEVLVGDDDRPTMARLPIQLNDVPFDGMATIPSFDVRPGGYVPEGVENISMEGVWVWVETLVPTLGASEDRMGLRSVGSDGQPDAHLRFSLDVPKGVSIHAISLYPVESADARFWSTWDYRTPEERLLGVAQAGQSLNSDFAVTLGSYDGPTEFDLFAGSLADFPAGSSYDLEIFLSDGTVLFREFTLPTQQETTP